MYMKSPGFLGQYKRAEIYAMDLQRRMRKAELSLSRNPKEKRELRKEIRELEKAIKEKQDKEQGKLDL